MKIVDRGSGSPVVLIPGAQGRWEWMRPSVNALAKRCRVITFSLADEPTSGASFDEAAGIWSYVQQVNDVLQRANVRQATICGVSYGGLVAAAFAARHPEKVSALVLVSAIPPSWRPDARQSFFLRAPLLLSPLFCIASVRMCREIFAARGILSGVVFTTRHTVTVLANWFSPRLMARRARMVASLDVDRELSRLQCPTLVVTGEPSLDLVVPVAKTREYHRIWPHASAAVIARTGHLGPITKADEFADLVASFADRADQNANRTSTGRRASGGIGAG
jgi:pimeloyl-ACP methyl ester carboxylesterase